MKQQTDGSSTPCVWSDTLPLRLEWVAKVYGVSAEDVEHELRRLGVPIHAFLGTATFYLRDLYSAHARSQPAEPSGRRERVDHVERILALLHERDCSIEALKAEAGRGPQDVYELRPAEGGGTRTVRLKIQVCSKIQTGGAVHFNVPPSLLKELTREHLCWFWFVAPPFAPNHDFLVRSFDVERAPSADKGGTARSKGKRAAAKGKQLLVLRVKAEGYEGWHRDRQLDELLKDVGIGYHARQRAQQKPPSTRQ